MQEESKSSMRVGVLPRKSVGGILSLVLRDHWKKFHLV
jgi:hypothetical protein